MQPVGLRSIRWQLPLSYAAIALLAAVALSAMLIGLLREYYAQQETQLLERSSIMAARALGNRLDRPLSSENVAAAVSGLGFVPDYRVELIGPDENVLFDTGYLDVFTVNITRPADSRPAGLLALFDPVLHWIRQLLGVTPFTEWTLAFGASPPTLAVPADVTFLPAQISGATSIQSQQSGSGGEDAPSWLVQRPVGEVGVLWGDGAPFLTRRLRSDRSMTAIITSPTAGVVGSIRLSDPPAIGTELIESVTTGAVIAGAAAVLIAGAAGWWVSLRLTRPLGALSEATARMTAGDLSARVRVARGDELGALGQSFNVMAGKVEHTVAALRRFAADAAHELHTPLTALRANLELTRERPDAHRLSEAVAQVGRLEALADDLLDLSRLEASEPPRREPVEPGALAREISEVYASRAEQAGVEFNLNVSEPLPPIRANPTQLRRALGNLLDNAVKFTPSGGEVRVSASRENGSMQFTVEDTGIGIPPQDLSALFSRFHRGSNTSDYPGSGLGLAMVKAIADAHGGGVSAENTPSGTRFTLTLPVG